MKKKWLSWDIRQVKAYDPEKDLGLVRRYIDGQFEARLVKTPEGANKELYKQYRRNWGIVYQALKRLYSDNEIHAYWFFRSGELKITWKCENKFNKIEQKQICRIVNLNHNITYLERPSKEHDIDKRLHKQQYATFRSSTSCERVPELKTFPVFTIEALHKIKYDNFIKRKEALEAEARAEKGGTCYNWDELNGPAMAKKYDVYMVFWRSSEELKRINKEKRS